MYMKSAIPTALRPADLTVGYMEQESILSSAKKEMEGRKKGRRQSRKQEFSPDEITLERNPAQWARAQD